MMNLIDKMGNNAEQVQNKIVNAQAEILLDTMKNTINVDTGRTRDSLKASGVLTKDGEKYPFLRPSFYKCKQEMIEKTKEIIEQELRK